MLSSLLLSLLSVSAALATGPPGYGPPSSGPVANAGHNVTYRGFIYNTVEAFLGIQFAESTAGNNRFKPPVPFVPPADSVVQATTGGPACPQQPYSKKNNGGVFGAVGGGPPANISEDCLRLNVWRPQGTKAGDDLPVLVWIYGGGFDAGYKDEVGIYPTEMINQSIANGHPIMHVELNYRLGIFGFAQSKALYNEGSENAGLRDQRLAIEWVEQNIKNFGGDPTRITLHGQSSGGLAVGMQMLAYGAQKPFPFHQSICESQALEPGITGNYTREAMALALGVTSCGNASIDSVATLDCLRSLPLKKLLDAQLSTATQKNIGDIWLPTVDGPNGFLPEAPSSLINQKKFHQVPTTIGWCEDDGTIFVSDPPISTAQEAAGYMQFYLPSFSQSRLNQLLSLYPISEFQNTVGPNGQVVFPAQQHRVARIVRDILFTCQPIFFGEAIAKSGNNVYLYDQNATLYTPILEKAGLYGYGVIHSSELAYIFGNITSQEAIQTLNITAADIKLATQETRSWSSFTATGMPSLSGHETLPGWGTADFKSDTFGVYVIGGPTPGYSGNNGVAAAAAAMKQQQLQTRCAFINSPESIAQLNY